MKGLFKSLPFLILLGMLFGIFCGLFFGEKCAFLTPGGDAYLMLLRMSVVPYIACALIHGIGRLSIDEAKRLLRKGWPFFLLIWVFTLGIIYSLKLLLPTDFTGVTASHELMQIDQNSLDFLKLFIPTNPFKALANDIIPAIVVFCVLFGAALIKLPNKNGILNPLETALAGLNRLTLWVTYVSPIGVFALMASNTGTINLVDVDKIQLYLLAVLIGSLFLALWLFPIIITSLTDIKYSDFFKECSTMFLLAFTAANPLIAFPYLLKAVKNLSNKCYIPEKDSEKTCEAVVPIALNFPTAGNFFALLFIIFLAFYYGLSLDFVDYLKLNSLGFVALFGPPTQIGSAIAFLIDILQIPEEGQNLYLNSFLFTRYFIALVSVAGVTTLTILIIFSYAHKLRFRAKTLLTNGALSIFILAAALITGRSFETAPKNITPSFARLKLDHIVPVSVNMTAVQSIALNNLPDVIREDALDRIRKTKTLRVGYSAHSMPFSYFNVDNDLVGFDIALAYQLAYELNAQLELIPFTWTDVCNNLQTDAFDIAMSGILVESAKMEGCFATSPYMQGSYALVVRDYQRSNYNNYSRVKSRKGIKIAVLDRTVLPTVAQNLFPNAEIVIINQIQEFLKPHTADALFWTEEAAYPWTLFHPQFVVVAPSAGMAKSSYAFLTATHSPKLLAYMNDWLIKEHQLIEKEQRIWFAKKVINESGRWCILKDVLHWSE
jgi:Na+/H+-dicarboxylate symporter/ABC-type amino acid transport substrate-binding protein